MWNIFLGNFPRQGYMRNMDGEHAKFSPRKTTSRRNCCVPQCSSVGWHNLDLRFHTFPPEGEFVFITNKLGIREKCDRRKSWVKVLRIGKPLTKNMFVCSRHFLHSDYILSDVPSKVRYLKKCAIPSCNLPLTTSNPKIAERKLEAGYRKRPRKCVIPDALEMVPQDKVCFVPGCSSGSQKTRRVNREKGYKNPVMVQAPNDPDLLALWASAINRKDRTLRSSHVVCELHFQDCEVLNLSETIQPGDNVHRFERVMYKLKENAVPSIFPEVKQVRNPGKSKKQSRRGYSRKSPAVNGEEGSSLGGAEDEQNEVSATSPGGPSAPVDELDVDVECSVFDFQFLLKEAHNIVLPSDMWTVGVLRGNRIIFANWSDGETVEAKKKVLVDDELHVKVVFGSIHLSLENMKEAHSLEEVANFLLAIDLLNICEGYGKGTDSRSLGCLGYILPRNLTHGEVLSESSMQCCQCLNARKDAVGSKRIKEANGASKRNDKSSDNGNKISQKCSLYQKDRNKLSLHRVGLPVRKPCVVCPAEGRCVDDRRCAAEAVVVVEGEEVEIEEWTPPPEWSSLTSPQHLRLSPPRYSFELPDVEMLGGREEVARSLDIEVLVKEAHCIPLPSEAWTVGVVKQKQLIFASWEDGDVLEARKRLFIDENLITKVVFGCKILSLPDVKEVHKIEDVSRYLYIIDKLRECYGLGTGRRAASCPGYFLPGAGTRACVLRCAFCQGAREEVIRMRRLRGKHGEARAEVQGKVWKNLKKLSDIYPELRTGQRSLS